MIFKLGALLGALLMAAGPAWQPASAAPAKASCPVCVVMKGESEAEPVKAVRTWEGREYHFCSEKCAKSFESDPVAFVPPILPRTTPAFALRDLAGRPLSPASLEGEVVLLDFWATWCLPCRKSMPELQALHEKYAERGLAVVGISIDQGDPGRVKRFVAARRLTYPIAVDSEQNAAWEAFHVKAVPAAYLIDRGGRIVAQWTGSPANPKDLERMVEELLAAKP